MKRSLAIVGGGACALMLASELDPEKFRVSVYERNAAPGRKFLVAGEGGLNLTHSENAPDFISRYLPPVFMARAFAHFSNQDLVRWINALGIKTYVGSSGRVFPVKGIRPIEVLNSMLAKIKENKAELFTKYNFQDFSPGGELVFENNGEQKKVKADLVIFCMGGASWPVTGSTGDWVNVFKNKNIRVNPFRASNCAFKAAWPPELLSKTEGRALKNISICCGNKKHAGEVVITKFGIEGSGIYPLSPEIRRLLETEGEAEIIIDFKPDITEEKLLEKLKSKVKTRNLAEHLKAELHLSSTQVHLLRHFLSKADYTNETILANNIKQFSLRITGTGPIEEAISTVGGVDLQEIDPYFQLNKLPGYFVIGEMLDYDAPTGGYLLQSCFSMANYLADHLNLSHF